MFKQEQTEHKNQIQIYLLMSFIFLNVRYIIKIVNIVVESSFFQVQFSVNKVCMQTEIDNKQNLSWNHQFSATNIITTYR